MRPSRSVDSSGELGDALPHHLAAELERQRPVGVGGWCLQIHLDRVQPGAASQKSDQLWMHRADMGRVDHVGAHQGVEALGVDRLDDQLAAWS